MTRLLVLQGGKMSWLGRREPEIYGTITADVLDEMIRAHAHQNSYDVEIAYRNSEGEAIGALHAAETSGVDVWS